MGCAALSQARTNRNSPREPRRLRAGDVHGVSVLDVGGGIGAIELELLAAGAERATNVELSGEYEQSPRSCSLSAGSPVVRSAESATSSRMPS